MNTPQNLRENAAPLPAVQRFSAALFNLSVAATCLSAVASIALSLTTWRTVDALLEREATLRADERRFQQDLVKGVSDLAASTGVLNSADLCLVRFRLRLPDGIAWPMRPPELSLEQLVGEARDVVPVASRPAIGDRVDFGLLPPGRYRLGARMPDGMELSHEFEVLPGVPVDRVVVCPLAAHSTLPTRIEVTWPEPLRGTRLVALCRVRPNFVHGEWRWRPPESEERSAFFQSDKPSGAATTYATLGDPWMLPVSGPIESDAPPTVPLPFRYCELAEITVLEERTDGDGNPVLKELATFLFSPCDPSRLDSALPAGAKTVLLSTEPPRFECKEHYGSWDIAVPPEMAEEIVRRLHAQEEEIISLLYGLPFRGRIKPQANRMN